MPVENWSEDVVIARLTDDPQLMEDLAGLDAVKDRKHVVLDFSGVHYINSSNIAKLLQLRRRQVSNDAKLILCNVGDPVWGALMVTALDKLFDFSDDVTTALATLQMKAAGKR